MTGLAVTGLAVPRHPPQPQRSLGTLNKSSTTRAVCSRLAFRCSGWTGLESRGSLTPMTIILILAVALVAGLIIQSRWSLLLPLGLGAGVASAIAATGHALSDTPIPFLVVVSTLVMVGGQGLRSRVISPTS